MLMMMITSVNKCPSCEIVRRPSCYSSAANVKKKKPCSFNILILSLLWIKLLPRCAVKTLVETTVFVFSWEIMRFFTNAKLFSEKMIHL